MPTIWGSAKPYIEGSCSNHVCNHVLHKKAVAAEFKSVFTTRICFDYPICSLHLFRCHTGGTPVQVSSIVFGYIEFRNLVVRNHASVKGGLNVEVG
jgi:hypothetical protein